MKGMAFVGQSASCPGDLFFWTPGEPVERLTTSNPALARPSSAHRPWCATRRATAWRSKDSSLHPWAMRRERSIHSWWWCMADRSITGPTPGCRRTANPARSSQERGTRSSIRTTGRARDTAWSSPHPDSVIRPGKSSTISRTASTILPAAGIADRERVGLGGGSYGGYAAAWFATYYTRYVRAVVMFVGVSDLISRNGTTDIAYEELFVHSGKAARRDVGPLPQTEPGVLGEAEFHRHADLRRRRRPARAAVRRAWSCIAG